MLKQLTIKNYALIDELSVAFHPHLNTLTGETGAGKSIIIGALELILGARARMEDIRHGEESAFVEALFDSVPFLDQKLREEQIETFPDGLLVRREIHASGRSRCFINDAPVSLNFLAVAGDLLVDLHGQHDHQALLKTERHQEYLDAFGVDPVIKRTVQEAFASVQKINQELASLREKEAHLKEKRDLLAFLVHEIEAVNPQPGEEEDLEQEEKLMRNSERLYETSRTMDQFLYEDEAAVIERLAQIESSLDRIRTVDPKIEQWLSECRTARIQIEEMTKAFQSFVSNIDFDAERLEGIRERLGQFTQLKKKYGGSMEAVLQKLGDGKETLHTIESFDASIHRLQTELEEALEILTVQSLKLSSNRKTIAERLEARMTSMLSELGLQNGIFKVQLAHLQDPAGWIKINDQSVSVTKNGIDRIEFLISMNPGEPPKPLVRIASGGEISRLMLALKTVLADADKIPVLVFDEIDTGISGRIAHVVGKNLRSLSRRHQLICITHLPQIASMGDRHFSVVKEVSDGSTRTLVRSLDDESRVREIAKLLGGETITESALNSARELIKSEMS